ncbi:MAG TPA: ChbG/HpnK family deacetylase [Chloroflexota bacterium]|nr:ChbG/HpnK family deacetylase [Chloroflexota bacterium]
MRLSLSGQPLPTASPGGREAGPRLLIVNADDYGLSPGLNAGVLAAHRAGLVTSASVLVNQPWAADAIAAAPPTLGLGLHLNLSTGMPCAGAARVPSLVDAQGRFLRLDRLLLRLSLGQVRRGDLEREIAAQLERALALGAALDHLDGHHHIHLHPAVLPVALRLAIAYGVRAVRCPEETGRPSHREPWHNRARRLAIAAAARRLRPRALAAGLLTTEHFRGLALGTAFDTTALAATLARLPPGLTELMCHPGYPDAALAQRTSYAAGRERELAALTAPEVLAVVRARGIVLTTYRAVVQARAEARSPLAG